MLYETAHCSKHCTDCTATHVNHLMPLSAAAVEEVAGAVEGTACPAPAEVDAPVRSVR